MQWIDYGDTEIVSTANVKMLDEKDKQIIAFGRRVFVPIKFIGDDESVVKNRLINTMETKNQQKLKVIDIYRSYVIGDLLENGNSVTDSLVRERQVEKLTLDQLKNVIDKVLEEEAKIKAPEAVGEKNLVQAIEKDVAVEVVEEAIPVAVSEKIIPIVEVPEKAIPVESAQQINAVTIPVSEKPQRNPRDVAEISHSDNPNHFYMQLHSELDDLESFQEQLQIVAPSFPALCDKRVGQICVAKYSLDNCWYRAKIIDSDGDTTSIQYIDFGNTDTITDNSFLKSSNESFNKRKPCAMECSLPIRPLGSTEWNEKVCEKLIKLMNIPIEFELISKDENKHHVKLFVGGRDIIEEMLFEGLAFKDLAEPCEIIKSGESGFVSHLNSLNDFFIQVGSDTEALGLIEEHLADFTKYDVLSNPKNGMVCCARFSDGEYYRAQVVDDTPNDNGSEVEFLDYGNTFRTKDLRTLSPTIANIPHLRKRCCLKMPDDIEKWSESAEKKFIEIAAEGQTEFKVKLIKPGKNACVELFIKDENISNSLSQLCDKKQTPPEVIDEHELNRSPVQQTIDLKQYMNAKHDCFITHANSPIDFYIQFTDKENESNVMSANLQGASDFEAYDLNDVNVDEIVAAFYPDFSCYYRAKVLSKQPDGIEVHFIDFGNKFVSTDLRKISDVLKAKEPLAIQCKLNDEAINDSDISQVIMNEESATFQLEILSIDTIPITVQLYKNQAEMTNSFDVINISDNSVAVETENSVELINEPDFLCVDHPIDPIEAILNEIIAEAVKVP